MDTFRAAWLIACRDLRSYFRDRTGMLLGFALPIALVGVFGFLSTFLYGEGGAMGRASLWVADEDQSESSARFLQLLADAETVSLHPAVGEDAVTESELRQKIIDGEIHHGLVLTAGFGQTMEQGGLPTLRMLRDPGRTMEDMMIQIGIMQAYFGVTEGNAWPAMMGRQMRQLGMDDDMAKQVESFSESTLQLMRTVFPKSEEEPEAKNEELAGFDMQNFFTQMVPMEEEDFSPPDRPKMVTWMQAQSISGITVMMLMFGLLACGVSLIREREEGTMQRLLASPAPRSAILWGKFMFTAIVGFIQLTVLLTFGETVFHVDTFRDPATLLALMVCTTLAITSFGMLIASWAQTQKQAEGVSTLLILMMSCLGGAWFPLQAFDVPVYVHYAMRSTLTHWAISGFQGMFWHQQSWLHPAMLLDLSVLLGFSVLAACGSLLLFRRRLDA